MDLKYQIDNNTLLFSEFDYVISIGHRCTSAIGIREARMRDASYPFDWVYADHTANVLEAIKDDFAGYFPIDMVGAWNKYKIGFNHLPTNSVQENHIIFQRRIERFRNVLKSNKNVLFVYANEDYICSTKHRGIGSDTRYNALLELSSFLSSNFSLNFQILCIDSVYRISTPKIIHVFVEIPHNCIANDDYKKPEAKRLTDVYRKLVGTILLNAGFQYNNQGQPALGVTLSKTVTAENFFD